MSILGKHIILELYECPASKLNHPDILETCMQEAATEMGATAVESRFHHFSPIGVSGVVIIMESHLTIHTWPEYGYAAIDIFTCGDIALEKGITYIVDALSAKRYESQLLQRGVGVGKHIVE